VPASDVAAGRATNVPAIAENPIPHRSFIFNRVPPARSYPRPTASGMEYSPQPLARCARRHSLCGARVPNLIHIGRSRFRAYTVRFQKAL
jgi:hypothetical protein